MVDEGYPDQLPPSPGRPSPQRDLPNVILTSHHASTTEPEERRGAEALVTVHAWPDGQPVGALTHDRFGRMT